MYSAESRIRCGKEGVSSGPSSENPASSRSSQNASTLTSPALRENCWVSRSQAPAVTWMPLRLAPARASLIFATNSFAVLPISIDTKVYADVREKLCLLFRYRYRELE